MKYLKITLLWEKRALFGQILQGTMSDYGALISFGIFLGIVVDNVEIFLVTSTKIYYSTLILSFFLVGPQLLERIAGKEGMTFFMGAMQFSNKKN